MNQTTPLFLLRTVLYPGGPLPLRIFERRYLDMVSECARTGAPFGVVLPNGSDSADLLGRRGTLARIVDFDQLDDGLLGIKVIGEQRFEVHATETAEHGLVRAAINPVPAEPPVSVPPAMAGLSNLVEQLMRSVGHHYPDYNTERLSQASWVGCRLAELFPLDLDQRQQLLELDDPVTRLERLVYWLPRLAD